MREETRLVAYPMSDVSVIAGGNILALCRCVKEKTVSERRSIFSFGDSLAAAYGKTHEKYELELTHIPTNDGVSFSGDGFTVILVRNGRRTEYSPCVCISSQSQQQPGEPASETVVLRAGGRRDVLI